MATGSRRAKVTPETKEESRRLSALWATRPHPGQAEFGEKYAIGNQSAVSQFLRGEAPLSLKAARGFAQGLGCRVEDFSPRLAAEVTTIASMVPGDALLPEVAKVAGQINALPPRERTWILGVIQQSLEVLQLPADSISLSESPSSQEAKNQRRKVA